MDKIDLHGVESKLDEIARRLDKPFEDLDTKERHREILKTQERHHKELLQSQNEFNEKSLSKQKDLVNWTRYLAIATIILCFFSMATAWITKNSIDLQLRLYSPKITVQITDKKLTWSHYSQEYNHTVWKKYWNDSRYSIPIYIEINNNGMVPFQLDNIWFETACGLGNRGALDLPNNLSKVIEEGKHIEFTDILNLPSNTTVQEWLPCEIKFTIYGNNLVPMSKKITLVK